MQDRRWSVLSCWVLALVSVWCIVDVSMNSGIVQYSFRSSTKTETVAGTLGCFEPYNASENSRQVEVALRLLTERWAPNIVVEHHNLNKENISGVGAFNLTCAPKVWLLLSGQYRSFKFLRPSVLDMLKASAGDCWFVSLLVSAERHDKDVLEDDAAYFQGRLAYLSLQRRGVALTDKWYNYPIHWYGTFLVADLVRRAHPCAWRPPAATVIIRHRPDVTFRECVDVDAAARVLARRGYLILGQVMSADNSLTTNWLTYERQIAEPLFNGSDIGLNNGWQVGGHCFPTCQPLCRERNDTFCIVPMYLSWENHAICRLIANETSSWCVDNLPPDHRLNTTSCRDVTAGVFCVHPPRWQQLPAALQPTASEIAGNLKVVEVQYMPNKGYAVCRTPQDL